MSDGKNKKKREKGRLKRNKDRKREKGRENDEKKERRQENEFPPLTLLSTTTSLVAAAAANPPSALQVRNGVAELAETTQNCNRRSREPRAHTDAETDQMPAPRWAQAWSFENER